MKKNIILIALLCIVNLKAQIGMNTTTPSSTLDITAKIPTGNSTEVDGLLIPRIDRQRAQSMTPVPISTLIYINDTSTGTQTGSAINIDSTGYYYNNGNFWVKLTPNSWLINGNTDTNPGTSSVGYAIDGNFIGNSDAKDLTFGINNIKKGVLDTRGNLIIGGAQDNPASGTKNMISGATSVDNLIVGSNNTSNSRNGIILGTGNTSSGSYSIALGNSNSASSNYAFVQGLTNTATAQFAQALGEQNNASGIHSLALGFTNVSSGIYAKALGSFLTVQAFNDTAIGQYNAFTAGNSSSFIATDPILQVGIGQSSATAENAFTILKNGNTAVGSHTTKPASTLEVNGTIAGKLIVISGNILDLNNTSAYSIINPSGNGNVTINLPAANSCPGRLYRIINHDFGNGTVTFSTGIKYANITTTNLDNMDLEGSSGTNITKVTIQSDGTNWWMIGN
ncbi:hypothetical protein [Chryseobacterium sp. MA9]|uniref:hypothetical protein n=1 Tax=Chryseobacterium sp. MA9 TaxID=2966625 RepID=UPI00210403AC|nr:hypothetical protein [Chryseobacterium sp. MA9]UTX49026.1 hypothetical protein KIK00_01780 [Chryseobacterium sp. MA9]